MFRCNIPAQVCYDTMIAAVGDSLNAEREFDIRRAVERKHKGQLSEDAESGSKWPQPDVTAIERIVAASNLTVASLTGSPSNQVGSYSLNEILRVITYPRQLVCAGVTFETACTTPIESLIRNKHKENFQFILANPLRTRTGK